MFRTRPLWALKSVAVLRAGPSSLGLPELVLAPPALLQSICSCHLRIAQPRNAAARERGACTRCLVGGSKAKGPWLVLVLLLALSPCGENIAVLVERGLSPSTRDVPLADENVVLSTQKQVKPGMGNSVPLDHSLISVSFLRAVASLPLSAVGQPCHSLLSQWHLAALPWCSLCSLVPVDCVCVCWKRTEGTGARCLSRETVPD